MSDTKEKIMMTALRLFAKDGYEAVSVSRIAGELGMTKGALYKHYKNKRDIFDSILNHVFRMDMERSKKTGMTEDDFDKMPQPFRNTTVESVMAYMKAQFSYWTEDETACNFRRMLTLEQYRNPEMANLYQKVLASGPVNYIEDLFREMMLSGTWLEGSPRQMAVEFFAPFYLLLSMSDAASGKEEKEKVAVLFTTHLECFVETYAAKMP